MDDRRAFRPAGEEVFRDTVAVVGDDAVGDVQDLRGAAVILIQDDVRIGGELDEFRGFGTAPFIDALVGVANHEDVPVLGAQFLDEVPIVGIAVLRLIDHDVIQLVLPVFPRIRETVKDEEGEVHQVVEVQRPTLHLAAQVADQVAGATHLVGDDRAGKHPGLDVAVQGFLGADAVQEVLDSLFGPFDAKLVHAFLGQGLGILFVEDGEGFREAQPVDFLAEELDAEAVQGADKVVVIAAVDHQGDAAAHFGGRLVGKGEAEDVGRIDAQHIDQIGVAVGQGLGLPGTRTGNDTHPAFRGGDGRPLPAVQVLQEAHGLLYIRRMPSASISGSACLWPSAST